MNAFHLALFGFVTATVAPAVAQTATAYPVRPITLIVPFAAGGTNDTLSRLIAEHLSKSLGQPVLIENDAGAAGTTPAGRAARAAPDGYTLLMGNMGTHGVAPALYPNLRYSPVRDFTPIGVTAAVPAVLVARKDLPVTSLQDFVAYVRANQARINEAHVGVGSPTHTFCTLLQRLMGTKTTRVAYRGGAQAMGDLVAGHVDFSCISLSGAISQIQAGAIKAIAVASPKRVDVVPDVPTSAEGGMPEFEVSTWNALFAPKGLPPAIQARLSLALGQALDDDVLRRRLVEMGFVMPASNARGAAALQALVESEVTRWATVVVAGSADGN